MRWALCFFGDGATNIGAFHEALNLAAVWSLPVVFVCENNLYGEYSPLAWTTPVERLADRVTPTECAPSGRRQRRARGPRRRRSAARGHDGPTFIEALTYRQRGHSRSDPAAYRPAGELERWLERDPILLHERALAGAGVPRERLAEIARRGRAGRRRRARARRWPTPTRSRLAVRPRLRVTEATYREAVNRAIAAELEADDDVFLIGEDVAAAGGVFKTTEGLQERFGADRVLDTPISEQAIVGTAIGAAVQGLRPLAEIMFADFAGVCFDQIANQLAKYRYMTGGQVRLPVTVRLANGAGTGFAAQHSQPVENWFLNVPGLKLVTPATPADAYALLRAAIRDDDPVLFFEHKGLLNVEGPAGRRVPASWAAPRSCAAATTSPWWRRSSCATARSRLRPRWLPRGSRSS